MPLPLTLHDGGKLPSVDRLESFRREFETRQPLFRETGGCHGAVIYDSDGSVLAVGEDVGRHNALDKAIGAARLAGHDLRRDVRPRRAAGALARAGHRVTVYGVLADGAEPEEDEGDVVLVRTPVGRSSASWRERFEPLARAALARECPDAFHAVGLGVLAPAAAAARARGGFCRA